MKAEQFIKDCTKTCSNEIVAKEPCFHEWVTPEQALKAIEIAREEWLSKSCEWLEDNLINYWSQLNADETGEFIDDFKFKMEK